MSKSFSRQSSFSGASEVEFHWVMNGENGHCHDAENHCNALKAEALRSDGKRMMRMMMMMMMIM